MSQEEFDQDYEDEEDYLDDEDETPCLSLGTRSINMDRVALIREVFSKHEQIPPTRWYHYKCPVCPANKTDKCSKNGKPVLPHSERKALEVGVGEGWRCLCGNSKRSCPDLSYDDHMVLELTEVLRGKYPERVEFVRSPLWKMSQKSPLPGQRPSCRIPWQLTDP